MRFDGSIPVSCIDECDAVGGSVKREVEGSIDSHKLHFFGF